MDFTRIGKGFRNLPPFQIMKTCGIPEIDTENKALLKEAKGVIRQKKNPKDILEKIYVFRMKLAYNKATESLESNFGWSKIYDDLIVKLKKNIKT
jgi:hypothetical protein